MNNVRNEEEVKQQYAYEFLWNLVPFGSLDIRHLTDKAYSLGISSHELAYILFEYQQECGNLFDDSKRTTDINAIFNNYILTMARNDIMDTINLDLSDYDIYFFANYMDDPLQYDTELVDDINKKIKELELTSSDFDEFSNYIFDKMGVSIDE